MSGLSEELGKALRHALVDAGGRSAREVSIAAGLSQSTGSLIFRGLKPPNTDQLEALCDVLEVVDFVTLLTSAKERADARALAGEAGARPPITRTVTRRKRDVAPKTGDSKSMRKPRPSEGKPARAKSKEVLPQVANPEEPRPDTRNTGGASER